MKVVPLYCPNCGAPVGKDAKFCSQCGSPLVIIDDVNRSEHTYHQIDDARIREADVRESIELRKMEVELEKQKHETRTTLLVLLFCFIIIPALGLFVLSLL